MAEDLAPSAGKIRVKITCPLALVADLEADSALIPAIQGNFLIMPRKTPAFYLLKEGQVILHRVGQTDKIFWISKGVCEVRRDICAIMAWAVEKASVRIDVIRSELEQGEKALMNLPSGKSAQAEQNRLDFYRFILNNIDE